MSKVVLVRCETYDDHRVKQAVEKGIDLLGGVEKFANNGEKILLKPNLLVGEVPEKCVTTHPAVFKAVAEVFIATGAEISFGDSPSMGSPAKAAKKSGLLDIAEELNVALGDFITGQEIYFEDGIQNRKFTIANAILENDGVISLPKLKTHGLVRFTGSLKNQFGCIPGILKGEYHVKLPDASSFAKMLVDLNMYVHPRLYIMDGILAMDGNGPRGGTPRQMNVLLFSDDPIALDATVCRLIDLDPLFVPTIKYGREFGAGTHLKEEIELLGDPIEGLKDEGFNAERTPIKPFKQKGAMQFANNRLVPKPFIENESCVSCGTCVSMCPANPKALDWPDGDKSKIPVYDYKNCIKCYCCQELCPESAIFLKTPLLRKLLNYVLP